MPDIPPCDLLLIGGDITPLHDHKLSFQAEWLDTVFRAWLENVPARKIFGVAGNHDFVFQHEPDWVPKDLAWNYLQDSGCEWEGLRFTVLRASARRAERIEVRRIDESRPTLPSHVGPEPPH